MMNRSVRSTVLQINLADPKLDIKVKIYRKGCCMFSQTNEYALRVITFLAADPNTSQTNASLAEATKVPSGYLYKILTTLERAGLVRSQRGKHGGYTLNRPAEKLTVLDVVQAIDPIPRIHTCPLNLKSHGTRLCPLHKHLDQTFAMIEKTFRDTVIADLLADRSGSIPLCEEKGRGHERRVLLTVTR
jgi:Rrf2 family nitric oxide-sensitive transcriptional repressor